MKYPLKIAVIGATLALLLPIGTILADDYHGQRWIPPKHHGWVPPGHRYDHSYPKHYNYKHYKHKYYKKYPKWSEHKKREYQHWKYHQPHPRDGYYGYHGSASPHRKSYVPILPRVIIREHDGYSRGYRW